MTDIFVSEFIEFSEIFKENSNEISAQFKKNSNHYQSKRSGNTRINVCINRSIALEVDI